MESRNDFTKSHLNFFTGNMKIFKRYTFLNVCTCIYVLKLMNIFLKYIEMDCTTQRVYKSKPFGSEVLQDTRH